MFLRGYCPRTTGYTDEMQFRENELFARASSNWFAGFASWRTAYLLEKRVLHRHTVEQAALPLWGYESEIFDDLKVAIGELFDKR
ncbi:hypothetical protein Mal48_03260 [Thalassoglobus polymorphus]|uniref:Uncharacterized protein n=1 Tax=Thalassoglobus polymorphus TaxID=2527994 RepID=A0A517QHL0_9PLAN|nr:hypothetical protein Mal48_03260 [Thalassoglobus polymorphus]